MAGYGVMVNSIWVAFSLIPILPWDGGIFIDTFLNAKQSMQFRKIEPYGTWIILILLFSGLLAKTDLADYCYDSGRSADGCYVVYLNVLSEKAV